MSFTAALLIVAQSAAPQIAEASAASPASRARPVAVQARASARVLRPARIDFSQLQAASAQAPNASVNGMQRGRDAAGTEWVEFN
ncbi:MAG: hypothetical protein ABJK59_08340 [Erythrobacter sp.]|uniref:hypothetical protein n=1 Tax=Erythrobacter sp. TaxID=1042 RepID=UPI003298911E